MLTVIDLGCRVIDQVHLTYAPFVTWKSGSNS